ncbi:hypothetical protein V2J09_020623 [Rumex salicifolius]
MSSKREEERNEKIIRGLMKLPPNRRCINCNSLGPQYVCNSFWTFVCITCSGIHREFTHRVKSVSMSKFTSQEVESLQNGGNQRAKEMFLKDWDFERQRLPSGNNVEKIREFIKNSQRAEPETRRASSYHSYSQSPPYDFQYEERWARKQGVMLTRKPGSDRGVYDGKVSGLYSPGRYSDHITAERFTIEGSSSRVSDYSISSGGDPFRSHPQSPNSLKDSGLNSPTFDNSKESHANDDQHQTGITHTERMASSTNYGDSSTSSLNQVNFASFDDAFPQPDQSSSAHQNLAATVPSVSQSFAPVNTTTVDPFKDPHEKHPVNSVSFVDLFQSPAMPSLVDLFQGTSNSSASADNFVSTHTSLSSLSFFEKSPQHSNDINSGATQSEPVPDNSISSQSPSLSSLSFFEVPQISSTVNIDVAHSESAPKNVVSSHTSSMPSLSFFEQNSQNSSDMNSGSVADSVGWATFDLQQQAFTSKNQDFVAAAEHSGTSVDDFNSISASHSNTQWPDFSSPVQGASPLMSSSQHENMHYSPALAIAPNNKEWRPFDNAKQGSGEHLFADKSSTADHFMGSIESEVELHSHFERSTSNPFDIPYEAEFDNRDMFYDMSTLQAALPSTDLPPSFAGAISDSWFLQDAANPGGISYMAAQAPNSQLPNVQTHGPVASIGGNPFA